MEKLFYLRKMFFFHIALSSSHKSFNGVTPAGGSKINGVRGSPYTVEISVSHFHRLVPPNPFPKD
jgi:hypothetical protein